MYACLHKADALAAPSQESLRASKATSGMFLVNALYKKSFDGYCLDNCLT